jgi:23S rRNA (pseudouridine1915-N3)-methyltransferase
MKITIITVGKLKEAFYRQAVAEFQKRLSRYCTITIVEVGDEKTPENASTLECQKILEKEGERIQKYLKEGDFICTLAIAGEQPDSLALAKKIEQLMLQGNSNFVFIIGGSLGLCKKVLTLAHWQLSFSNLTFPHQLMRVILLEQIYRSFRIIHGEPYHK